MLTIRVAYQRWDREGYGVSGVTGHKTGADHADDTAACPSTSADLQPVDRRQGRVRQGQPRRQQRRQAPELPGRAVLVRSGDATGERLELPKLGQETLVPDDIERSLRKSVGWWMRGSTTPCPTWA